MLKRGVIVLLLLIFLYILNAFLFPYPAKNVPAGFRPKYGFSYSFEQASWYGYDGRVEFVNLIDKNKFDWVRLPFFWDQMVDSGGNIKTEDLEFAIAEAGKRNIKVVVALGLKVPYHPEYHLPESIRNQIAFGDTIGVNHPISKELLDVDRKLVQKLSKYDNVSYWQVENEPFLANVNNWKIDKDLVAEEVKTVKGTDPQNRPIILSSVGPASFNNSWKKYFELLKPKDVFGVNAYFKTQGIYLMSFKIFAREVNIPWPRFFVWPVQSWYGFSPNYKSLRDFSADRNVELWVLEAQGEPYIRNLEDAQKKNNYFSPQDIARVDTFLKGERVENVGFWGANYWIYREKLGDSSWVEAVGRIVN